MNILLHTIALEPARWTPQRVSQPLVDLLPRIAGAGFRAVEIYEPHLGAQVVSPAILDAIGVSALSPVVLSSYLNLNPAQTSDSELDAKLDELARRVEYYGFSKVRLFPGSGMSPADEAGIRVFKERVRRAASRVATAQILLETHDGSLADDPEVIVQIASDLAPWKVGLLFQATFFQNVECIREQLRVEKAYVRHVHLQNRRPDLSFAAMPDGIIPWPEILRELGGIDATLEFVPRGVCGVDQFDLEATLAEARSEADWVQTALA